MCFYKYFYGYIHNKKIPPQNNESRSRSSKNEQPLCQFFKNIISHFLCSVF